jgi:hypothetical protein
LRKLFLVILAICLLTVNVAMGEATVAPQTREEVIALEGVEETVTTTYIESQRGYSIWIDTNVLAQVPEIEGAGMDDYAPPQSIEVTGDPNGTTGNLLSIYATSMNDYSFEQAVEDTRKMLMDSHGNVEDSPALGIFSEVNLPANLDAFGLMSTKEDSTIIYYLVPSGDQLFSLSLEYVNEDAEAFVPRVMEMLKSFRVLGQDGLSTEMEPSSTPEAALAGGTGN